MAITNGRTIWKHSPGEYRRHTVLHPLHAFLASATATLGAFAHETGLTFLGLVVVELFVFTCLPRVPWMRYAIDERVERRTRADAVAARGELLLRMSEDHRRELAELENLARAVREHRGTTVQECVAIDRLIELFVRFAIAHRATAALLEVAGSGSPDDTITLLGPRIKEAGGVVRGALERRLEVLQRRRDARRAAREEQTAIGHELATITDTLRCMQEQLAAGNHDALRMELREVLASREAASERLRDLSAARSEIDAGVLRVERDSGAERTVRVAADEHALDAAFAAVESLPMLARATRL